MIEQQLTPYRFVLPPPSLMPAEKMSRFIPETVQEKKKSRPVDIGITSSNMADDDPTGTVSPQQETVKVFALAENLVLLSSIFPRVSGNQRSFSWKHFTQEMVNAGFHITQGSGSSVVFKKEEGSIVFHRPHPDPTVDGMMLLRMGKRMKKWFDWDAGSFFVCTNEVKNE